MKGDTVRRLSAVVLAGVYQVTLHPIDGSRCV